MRATTSSFLEFAGGAYHRQLLGAEVKRVVVAELSGDSVQV